MKYWSTAVTVVVVLLLIYLIVDSTKTNPIYEGVVIDKWTTTKDNMRYFDNYYTKSTRYFIALDSIYDDLEIDQPRHKKVRIGEYFKCLIGVCNIRNERNRRDGL